MSRKQQLERFAAKQMEFLRGAEDKNARDYQMMLWAGFLSGLRLTNAITHQEYDDYYKDLQDLSEQLDAEQEKTA